MYSVSAARSRGCVYLRRGPRGSGSATGPTAACTSADGRRRWRVHTHARTHTKKKSIAAMSERIDGGRAEREAAAGGASALSACRGKIGNGDRGRRR